MLPKPLVNRYSSLQSLVLPCTISSSYHMVFLSILLLTGPAVLPSIDFSLLNQLLPLDVAFHVMPTRLWVHDANASGSTNFSPLVRKHSINGKLPASEVVEMISRLHGLISTAILVKVQLLFQNLYAPWHRVQELP